MANSESSLVEAVRLLEQGKWQAAHAIVQKDATTNGCWAHGIVHLIEGDFDNARYWYRRARRALPHGNTVAAEIAALKESVHELAAGHDAPAMPADATANEETRRPGNGRPRRPAGGS
jgi:hypothetical protein